MNRLLSVAVAVCVATGCSASTDPAPDASTTETALSKPSASTFAGTWRSVTPSLEFVRLTVTSKSSELGVLGAWLTFSGVYWEGSGRIEGDAYVANMTSAGSTAPNGVLVANARGAQTLLVQLRASTGTTTDLTFVREN